MFVVLTKELPDVSGAQNKAQEIRLGALIAELEKLLQKQSRSEKELRALDHHILNLATILKVSTYPPTHLSIYVSTCLKYIYCVFL